MTYPQTLDYLFTRLPMYQRTGGAAMKKDLTNIRLLLEALGNPEQNLRFVHVAGTNGKGTVSHLLAAALQAHGYRVGLYTSPHYKDFRERIKIDGAFISQEAVVDFVARIEPMIEQIEPSFFEITVAMALDYFAGAQVQWVILETGLGGRLDSTNAVDPVLSVITNIGYDHTQFLGETLPEIAGEKAGIIKAGRPVVIGLTQAETEGVFRRKASEEGSPILFADQHYSLRANYTRDDNFTHQHLYATDAIPPLDFPFPVAAAGPYVAENHRTALAALLRLNADGLIDLDPAALKTAWLKLSELTYYIGRWQVLGESPLTIADSAHNAEGLGPVIDLLNELNAYRKGHQHIVIGVVNDKDLHRVLPLFPTNASYYFVKADIPRGLPAEELHDAAAEYGLVGNEFGSVKKGFAAARKQAEAHDIIFVGGSIFTVAEVL
ncbi:dihydrofolate synthase/folylpolyglutamate synthase [Lewinella aquimaris]|uniref:Dihydrofolate synthase/folylpolyglutamate synthase n=1 Tax=Neolewinella aquimaris TaxID=1835722 RepID=A0A840DWX1_9BACT|nr:Mur ligase family protein [Neolewinella aquimaris]MBB4077440.1 dihydrofolate synthase/folylpolyglutamate synthase [Neolewinella aquimaris]